MKNLLEVEEYLQFENKHWAVQRTMWRTWRWIGDYLQWSSETLILQINQKPWNQLFLNLTCLKNLISTTHKHQATTQDTGFKRVVFETLTLKNKLKWLSQWDILSLISKSSQRNHKNIISVDAFSFLLFYIASIFGEKILPKHTFWWFSLNWSFPRVDGHDDLSFSKWSRDRFQSLCPSNRFKNYFSIQNRPNLTHAGLQADQP